MYSLTETEVWFNNQWNNGNHGQTIIKSYFTITALMVVSWLNFIIFSGIISGLLILSAIILAGCKAYSCDTNNNKWIFTIFNHYCSDKSSIYQSIILANVFGTMIGIAILSCIFKLDDNMMAGLAIISVPFMLSNFILVLDL